MPGPYNYTKIKKPGDGGYVKATDSPANADTFNAKFTQLDDAMGAAVASLTTTSKTLVGAINELAGGAPVSAARLAEWTEAEAYELIATTFDADNVITTATVKWPDGSAGTFTTTTKDATWLAINAYSITHTVSSKTVTQAAVTRDASGNISTKPALTVA